MSLAKVGSMGESLCSRTTLELGTKKKMADVKVKRDVLSSLEKVEVGVEEYKKAWLPKL